jgi:hypothetical protein
VVSYSQRKTKTGFQSLSPVGERNGSEVKIYGSKREIEAFIFVINRVYTRLYPPPWVSKSPQT